jgi:hypothetical protein
VKPMVPFRGLEMERALWPHSWAIIQRRVQTRALGETPDGGRDMKQAGLRLAR